MGKTLTNAELWALMATNMVRMEDGTTKSMADITLEIRAEQEARKRAQLASLYTAPAMPFPKCLHNNPWNNCTTCGTTPKAKP